MQESSPEKDLDLRGNENPNSGEKVIRVNDECSPMTAGSMSADPQIIETKVFTSRKLEEGIIENHVNDGQVIDADVAWALKKANMELATGREYGVLVSAGHLSEITRDARELIASKEYQMNTFAKAIVVQSVGQKIVVNFYLTINKPAIATRLFNSREDAMSWLRLKRDRRN